MSRFRTAGIAIVSLSLAAATLTPIEATAHRSDFFADGPADIPWYNPSSVTILNGKTTPGWTPTPNAITSAPTPLAAPVWAETGRFNGAEDALPVPNDFGDIAWYDGSTISTYFGRPGGTFVKAQTAAAVPTPVWAGTGDFDGDANTDGLPGGDGEFTDIAWYSGGFIKIYRAAGNGVLTLLPGSQAAPTPTWAGTGDFNNDGREDIAWLSGGSISLYLGKVDGTWTVVATNATGVPTPDWAGSGDFDADDRDDLAFHVGTALNVYYGGGTPAAPQWTIVNNAVTGVPAPVWAGTGDFNAKCSVISPDDIAWFVGGSIELIYGTDAPSCDPLVPGGTVYPPAPRGFNRVADTITGLASPRWAGSGQFAGQVGYGFPTAAPITVPGAPTSVVANAGNATASVTWVAPVDNGGAAIQNYTVTASPGGAAQTVATTSAAFTGLTNGTIYTFSVVARNSVGTGPAATSNPVTPVAPLPPPPPPVAYVEYTPLVPARFLDSRTLGSTFDGQSQRLGARVAGSTTELKVAGRGEVPGTAVAVALNVTVTSATAEGYVTVWPCGDTQPNASSLNYAAGSTIANAVISKPGTDGKVCLFTSGSIDLLADVGGFYPLGTKYTPLVPARLLETRDSATVDGRFRALGVRKAGSTTELIVGGRGGSPESAAAAVLNVTVVGAAADGYVTVWPCGSTQPDASSLNFAAGDTIPNAVITKLGAGGKVCLFTSADIQMLADLNGYYPAGSQYTPVVPGRMMDTRSGGSTTDTQFQRIGVRTAGSTTELLIGGRYNVPANASAVVLNVTAVSAQAGGYITVWPCGATQPNASSLNFDAGDTIPNAVITKLGPGGKVCIFTSAGTDMLTDLGGYYPAP